jgi:hypothetical protein
MDWRRKLTAYSDAQAELRRAERLLTNARARVDAARATGDQAIGARVLGADLAHRRAARDARRLRLATFDLTHGRPLDEVLWSAPDDI